MNCPRCHHLLTYSAPDIFSVTGLGLLPLSQRAAVDAYVKEAETAAVQLRSFAYRAQGPGLAGHDEIASAAEGQSWTLSQLRVRTCVCFNIWTNTE